MVDSLHVVDKGVSALVHGAMLHYLIQLVPEMQRVGGYQPQDSMNGFFFGENMKSVGSR